MSTDFYNGSPRALVLISARANHSYWKPGSLNLPNNANQTRQSWQLTTTAARAWSKADRSLTNSLEYLLYLFCIILFYSNHTYALKKQLGFSWGLRPQTPRRRPSASKKSAFGLHGSPSGPVGPKSRPSASMGPHQGRLGPKWNPVWISQKLEIKNGPQMDPEWSIWVETWSK